MWFKNLLLYRLDEGWSLAPGALEEKLARFPLTPCTGLNLKTRGWVSPRDNGQRVYSQERHLLIAMGTEEKILPAAVVMQVARERAAEIERQKGFKPGRKMMRELKDEVMAELLPRAFARQRTLRAWIDPANGWLVVDSASANRAEALLELLRETLGESSWSLLEPERAPADLMTQWLAAARAPKDFGLGDECEVAGGEATSPVVRYLRYSLDGDDVRRHLGQGKRATRLKLIWQGRVSFVLNDKLLIKRLSFLDMDEAREEAAAQNPDEQFDAEFALMAGELGAMLKDLAETLGLKALGDGRRETGDARTEQKRAA